MAALVDSDPGILNKEEISMNIKIFKQRVFT